jgi:hypothetical protein
LTGASRGKSAT